MRSITYRAQPIWQAKDVMQDISCNDPFDETSPIIPSHTTMSPKGPIGQVHRCWEQIN